MQFFVLTVVCLGLCCVGVAGDLISREVFLASGGRSLWDGIVGSV